VKRGAATIDVALLSRAWTEACPQARSLARQAARHAVAAGLAQQAAPTRVELAIALADDDAQRRLNREFRGRDGPTNVLAFPAAGPEQPRERPVMLGDVVLAFETVAREAAAAEKPLADHLRHLVVHGVLHLCGFDHATAPEAARMELLETSILATIGVPDPYRDTI
jgi:probable rRNA maturation factor